MLLQAQMEKIAWPGATLKVDSQFKARHQHGRRADGVDFGILILAWERTDGSLAHLNHDGQVECGGFEDSFEPWGID
jgi:hypothetical protein